MPTAHTSYASGAALLVGAAAWPLHSPSAAYCSRRRQHPQHTQHAQHAIPPQLPPNTPSTHTLNTHPQHTPNTPSTSAPCLPSQSSLVLPDLWLSHWSSLPPELQQDRANVAANLGVLAFLAGLAAVLVGLQAGSWPTPDPDPTPNPEHSPTPTPNPSPNPNPDSNPNPTQAGSWPQLCLRASSSLHDR